MTSADDRRTPTFKRVRVKSRLKEREYFVVETQQGREKVAFEFLTGAQYGCSVYFPRIRTRVSHAGRRVVVARPFLPRIMFVEASSIPSVRAVRYAPGVSRLLGFGDQLARLRQSAINLLKAREVDGFIKLDDEILPKNERVYKYGDKLKLNLDSGTLDVVFQHKIGAQRALVFFNWLGRECPARVNVKQLDYV